jgi:monoamine oxidase
MDLIDVAIVGGGSAGLAAAARLRRSPLSHLVLEAKGHIGGRAHTMEAGGYAFDLGCGWLHSADHNPYVAIAGELGFAIDRSPPPWTRQSGHQGASAGEMAAFRAEFNAMLGRLEEAAKSGRDRPASELMTPASPYNPTLDAFSAYYNGAEFDQVSVLDYEAYEDSGSNWRVPRGYGALVHAFGARAEVALETPVGLIDHSGETIRLETPQGALAARAVIVCVSTDMIAQEALRFSPTLPDKREAAAGLPLGLADKLSIAVDGAEEFESDGHLFGTLGRTETGSYHLRPFGRPLIEAYFGGRHARELETEGHGAFAAFAVEELVGLLGSDWRARLHPLAASAWASDPWIRGAYSHALPGCSGMRAVLAAPVDDRLFFAGEATSPHAFSTCHGAYESGVRAAEEAIAALGMS